MSNFFTTASGVVLGRATFIVNYVAAFMAAEANYRSHNWNNWRDRVSEPSNVGSNRDNDIRLRDDALYCAEKAWDEISDTHS